MLHFISCTTLQCNQQHILSLSHYYLLLFVIFLIIWLMFCNILRMCVFLFFICFPQALQYKPKVQRNRGRPRKRWRDQLDLRIKKQEIRPVLHEHDDGDENQRDALISQIYFWNRTLHVSDRFCVHHQESSTVYTATGICHTGYADCLVASSQHNLYVLLCVQYWTPVDGQRNCSKHVEFYSKNKF